MAKKKPKVEHYEFIHADIIDGTLTCTYQLPGKPIGRMSHDEDVSEFSDADIIDLIRSLLSVDGDDPVRIMVHFN